MNEQLLKNRIDQQKRASVRFDKFMKTHKKIKVLSPYVKATIKVQIRCRTCGHEWGMTPNKLLNGRGCPKCRTENNRKRCVDNNIEDRLKKKGIRLIGIYVNASIPVEMECSEGHRWTTVTDSILRTNGTGCPSCAKYGFKKDKPAILYYILINKTHYKVGVTNNTLRSRYSGTDNKIIEILGVHHYATGEEALIVEKKILTKYKEFKYEGKRLLKKAANTEILTCPIEFCR